MKLYMLSNRGFQIKKSDLTNEELSQIRKDCSVLPENNFGSFISPRINVFSETEDYMIVPLYYATNILKKTPREVSFKTPHTVDIKEFIELREQQKKCFSNATAEFYMEYGGGIINMATGGGKCFDAKTKIQMYSGESKNAEDIQLGDALLGEDYTPKIVRTLTFGAGYLYKVFDMDGNYFIANGGHTLVFKDFTTNRLVRKTVSQYISLDDTSELYGIRVIDGEYHYSKISIIYIQHGFYYGFELSGNSLFLLTNNMLVHNCHAKDTEILLNDFSVKKVQDIHPGDMLLGDDLTPRRVITTTKGYSRMYEISSGYGNSFTVNKDHILVLKNTQHRPNIIYRDKLFKVYWWEDNKYIVKSFENYETSLEFSRNICCQQISEISVRDFMKQSKRFKKTFKGYRVGITFDSKKTSIDPYSYGYNLVEYYKDIPADIMFNNVDVRERFLKGVLDSKKLERGELISLHKKLEFLCRCLYIPCRLTDKKLEIFYDRREYLFDIKIKKKNDDEYFGFTIDGNNRYLLRDLIVTHNTVVSIKIACASKLKTLIIVNKNTLMSQWEKELQRMCPDIKVGIIRGPVFDTSGDIIIGMLQTISKNTDKDYSWAGVVIIDEVHNIATNVFSRLLCNIRPKYLFGLTATLERKDKCEKIIKWYLGETLYSDINTQLKQPTELRTYRYCGKSSIEMLLRDNKTPAVSSMLTNIALDKKRNDIILEIIKKIAEDPERHILVISDRISQLKYLKKNLKEEEAGLFIGGSQDSTKQIILGTYSLVNEGFNIPRLNCIIFATPRSSITQAIGRIYRKHHDITPIIVDIVDDFSIFSSQYYTRRRIYKKCISELTLVGSKPMEITEDDEDDEECLV